MLRAFTCAFFHLEDRLLWVGVPTQGMGELCSSFNMSPEVSCSLFNTQHPYSYRKPLRDQLRKDGWPVNIVGTKVGGTNVSPVSGTVMSDNVGKKAPLAPLQLPMKTGPCCIDPGTDMIATIERGSCRRLRRDTDPRSSRQLALSPTKSCTDKCRSQRLHVQCRHS